MSANQPEAPEIRHAFEWPGSADPNDETFGDVVVEATLDGGPDEPDAADEAHTPVGEFDAVLVGEPYDGAVIGRPGAREGPRAIREQLAGTKTHHFDAGPVRSVADLGDLDLPRRTGEADPAVAAVQDAVRVVADRIHGADAFPVFVGGDNSLTYPNCVPLVAGADVGGSPAEWNRGSSASTGGDGTAGDRTVGAINFDAHLDCREPVEGPTSGTPYRQLIEAGLDDLAVVGARHFETSTTYHDYLRESGGRVVTAEEVGEDPVAAADRALDAVDADLVYVSVDLDVVDAAAAPGVNAPTPGGIAPRELFRALRVVASDPRVTGFEVVECAPSLEPGGGGAAEAGSTGDTGGFRTARVGARAIAHVLAARQTARRGSPGDVEEGSP